MSHVINQIRVKSGFPTDDILEAVEKCISEKMEST